MGVRERKGQTGRQGFCPEQIDGPVLAETGKVPAEHTVRGRVSSVQHAGSEKHARDLREDVKWVSGARIQSVGGREVSVSWRQESRSCQHS